MTCQRCVNRREFLARAGGAAAAAAIVACGDGAVSAPGFRPSGGITPFSVTVATVPELANVGVLVRVGPDGWVAAKRTGVSTFAAFDMRCTHEGCLVGITNGERFDCPCHFSRFDNNGAVVNGPAQRPLDHLTATYDPGTDQLSIS
jgi:nitrite reductase/ring-hydroxylating ferredoxin subunit